MATPPLDDRYVQARSGLLDALGALGPLRAATVLVGAQAVYEHTREQDREFGVAPFTYDADVALHPELLADDPRILDAMASAGFSLTGQPGLYKNAQGIQVDLLVPERLGGRRGRGAGLGVHGNRAARQVRGLEGALVSNSIFTIAALSPQDDRTYEIRVAGPASLVVAKVHKIVERIGARRREDDLDKDAFDVFRLLRAVDTAPLVEEFAALLASDVSRAVTEEALAHVPQLFASADGAGTALVARHLAGLEPEETTREAVAALARDLLENVPFNDG